jgi:hypothetical protein
VKTSQARLKQLTTKPRRVEVEWLDSGRAAGWEDAQAVLSSLDDSGDGGPSCWTCGYLVDEREESVTVAGSYTTDHKTGLHSEYNSALTIPRVALVDMRELRR